MCSLPTTQSSLYQHAALLTHFITLLTAIFVQQVYVAEVYNVNCVYDIFSTLYKVVLWEWMNSQRLPVLLSHVTP